MTGDRKYLTRDRLLPWLARTIVAASLVLISSAAVTKAQAAPIFVSGQIKITSATLMPRLLVIPPGGFASDQVFSVFIGIRNLNLMFDLLVTSAFVTLFEEDPSTDETVGMTSAGPPPEVRLAPGTLATLPVGFVVPASLLNSLCGVASCTESTGSVSEGGVLEFFSHVALEYGFDTAGGFSPGPGISFTTPVVPEPSSLALFFVGLAGLGYLVRRRRSTHQRRTS